MLKKCLRNTTLVALTLSMLFSLCSLTLAADLPIPNLLKTKGKAGKNITYTFNKKTGALTLSGKGAMYDYEDYYINKEKASPFAGDSKIKSIKFSDNITQIGTKAFKGLKIKTLKLPKKLKVVKQNAFYGSTRLKKVEFPKGLEVVGYEAFKDCKKLTNINLNAKTIKKGAFSNCANLNTVKLGNKVKTIEELVFAGSKLIKTFSLGEGVEVIGKNSLREANISTIKLPKSLKKIGKGFLEVAKNLEEIKLDSSNSNFELVDGVLFNESLTQVIKYPSLKQSSDFNAPKTVKWVRDFAFSYSKNLVNVKFETSLKEIGKSAFVSGSAISVVVLPESVSKIGTEAFRNCRKLTCINLPNKIQTIQDKVFKSCVRLKEINLPSSLKSIGEEAFYNCYKITKVTIPNTVQKIDDRAFNGCKNLGNITVGDNAIFIGYRVFGGTKWLENSTDEYVYLGKSLIKHISKSSEVNIKEDTLSIAGRAIVDDEEIIEVINIPDSVEYIGNYAFYGIKYLRSIKLPENIKIVGEFAFAYCGYLGKITAPDKYFEIGAGAFFETNWNGLKLNDILYDAVDSRLFDIIESKAIYVCANAYFIDYYNDYYLGFFRDIHIPDTIKYIAPKSFYNAAMISKVSIPVGVERIEEKTFAENELLELVELPSTINYIAKDAFEGTENVTIKGEKGSCAHKFAEKNKIKFKAAKFVQNLKISGVKDKVYSKKGIEHNIKIKDGNKLLKQGKEFEVEYVSGKKYGKYYAVIRGIGKYAGVVYKKFTVTKK